MPLVSLIVILIHGQVTHFTPGSLKQYEVQKPIVIALAKSNVERHLRCALYAIRVEYGLVATSSFFRLAPRQKPLTRVNFLE